MGNKTNNRPPSTKDQPLQALVSGETEAADVSDRLSKLKIPLVNIDLSILETVSKTDSITILWKENSFYCLVKNKVLGKVPVNYNSQLDSSIFYRGSILEFNKVQPKVVVQIIA